ncbi:MAG: hypothetical protein M3Y74_17430 [Chloroflexota bacterium]|nr:hypothetical protein [Chloroflexota bacterium]
MINDYATIDVSADPMLLGLAEQVRQTNQPRVLKRADEAIAIIAPLESMARRSPRKGISGGEKYATIAALTGAAGSLPVSASWEDVRETARDERLSTKFGPRP